MKKYDINTCYNFNKEVGCVQTDCRCEKEEDENYLDSFGVTKSQFEVFQELNKVSKQETLEEAAENYGWRIKKNTFSDPVKANDLANSAIKDFIAGAKWQEIRMYDKLEPIILEIKNKIETFEYYVNQQSFIIKYINEHFEQFKRK